MGSFRILLGDELGDELGFFEKKLDPSAQKSNCYIDKYGELRVNQTSEVFNIVIHRVR